MAKRILSWVLTCALLLTCISGITLIASAATVVKTFDATNIGWKNDAVSVGTKDGIQVVQFGNDGQAYWNNGLIRNAMGFNENTTVDSLTVSFDYFLDCSGEGDNVGGWVGMQTKRGDGSDYENTADANGGWVGGAEAWNANDVKLTANAWSTVTYTVPVDTLLGGGHDIGFKYANAGSRVLSIRGMKVVAVKGGDTYTVLWGSYRTAKIDFTGGTIATKNGFVHYNHPAERAAEIKAGTKPGYETKAGEAVAVTDQGLAQMDGQYGIAMFNQNQGFGVGVDNIGIVEGEPVAITIEYYFPADAPDNTRFHMNNFGDGAPNFTMRAGGNGVNVGALTKGAWNTFTFVVDGVAAARFVGGGVFNTYCFNGNDAAYFDGNGKRANWDGSWYLIGSVSVMPASMLTVAEDPGYEYFDFTKFVAPNPYYQQYTNPDALGIAWSLNNNEGTGAVTENGMEMESGPLYFTTTKALNQNDVGIKVYFKDEVTSGVGIEYQTNDPDDTSVEHNFKGATISYDGKVACAVLHDAAFTNKQQGKFSFRMYASGKTIERIEVYVLLDMTDLNNAIADAEAADTAGKTDASIQALADAIAAAQAVADNVFATQAEVDAAIAAVTGAVNGLKDIKQVGYGSRIDCTDYVALKRPTGENYQRVEEGNRIGFNSQGDYIDFQVNVTTAGLYDIAAVMTTQNAASTVELQDGNGKVYGSVEVPSTNWSDYQPYTFKGVKLEAGVQILRIYFAQSSANFRYMDLADGRYTVTNVQGIDGSSAGEIVELGDTYAWRFATGGNNKYFHLDGFNGVLTDGVSITYEVEVQFEKAARAFNVFYGYYDNANTPQQTSKQFVWTEAAVGQWYTYTFTVDKYAASKNYAGSPLTMFGHPHDDGTGDDTNIYVKSFKAYETDNPDKVVSIVFSEIPAEPVPDEYDVIVTDLELVNGEGEAVLPQTGMVVQFRFTVKNNGEIAIPAGEKYGAVVRLGGNDGEVIAWGDEYKQGNSPELQPGDTLTFITNGGPGNGTGWWEIPDADFELTAQVNDNPSDGLKEYDYTNNFLTKQFTLDIVEPQPEDTRYTVTNTTWDPAGSDGTIVEKDGFYAFKYEPGSNRWIGISDPDGILNNSTSVTYEYEIYFDTENGNDRVFASFGTTDGWMGVAEPSWVDPDDHSLGRIYGTGTGFAAGGQWIPVGGSWKAADGSENIKYTWGTLTVVNDKFDPTKISVGEITRLGSWVDNGGMYVRSIKVYDTEDPTKVISLVFNAVPQPPEPGEIEFELPDPNWTNKDQETNPTIGEFDGYRVLSWTNTGAMGWNGGVINKAAGYDEAGLLADLEITFTGYWDGQGGNWWHLNTVDANGESAPGLTNGKEHDLGFGSLADYGFKPGEWANVTIKREQQQFNSAFDNLYINVGGLDNGFYIRGIVFKATLDDGTVITAIWGAPDADDEPQPPEPAAIDVIVTDICFQLEDGSFTETPAVGDKVRLAFVVENVGTQTLPEGTKYGGIVKMGDAMLGWSDNYKSKDTAPALAPGENITLITCGGGANNDGTWTVPEGEFELFAQVNDNPGDGIADEDTSNNTFTKSFTSHAVDEYDVIITDLELVNADREVVAPIVDTKVFFKITVKNNGTIAIPAGAEYGFTVKYNGQLLGWGDEMKQGNSPELAPGATLELFTCGGPENGDGSWIIPEGEFALVAEINDTKNIKEFNYDNDIFTAEFISTFPDDSALRTAIEEGEAMDLSGYTEETAKAFTDALAAAKALDQGAPTQEELDAALKAINDAKAALVEKPVATAKLGDIDGDGNITSTDARLALQISVEKIKEADVDHPEVADVDGDGKITSTDARMLLQVSVGKISESDLIAKA